MRKKKKQELKTQIIPDVAFLYDDYGNSIYLHLRATVHWDSSLAGFIKQIDEANEEWRAIIKASKRGSK